MNPGPKATKTNRTRIISAVVVILLVGAAVAAYGLERGGSSSSSSKSSSSSQTVSSSASSTSQASSSSLSGGSFNTPGNLLITDQFNNRVIEVNPATNKIVWNFGSGNGSICNPGPGSTFMVILTVPGTYQYHCSFHSWMHGTIIVKS